MEEVKTYQRVEHVLLLRIFCWLLTSNMLQLCNNGVQLTLATQLTKSIVEPGHY